MSTILEAKNAYKKARAAFKTAQEDVSISEEDKTTQRQKMDELADNTVDALATATKHANLDFIDPDEESNVLERTNIGQEEEEEKESVTNEKQAKGRKANDDDNDDKNEIKKELDAMKIQVAQMIDDKKRTKIAMQYGKLFSEQMREARVKAFLSNKESIPVLTARFDEAATLLTNKTAIKVAQIENDKSIFDLVDLDGSHNNGLDYGGKI